MNFGYLIGAALFVLTYGLWVAYLAVMNLQRARDNGTLSKVAYVLGCPVMYGGLLLDFLANQLLMTIILLELPRELLVTARVSRHKKAGKGWRKKVAEWFCRVLLDPFDPDGCHCK